MILVTLYMLIINDDKYERNLVFEYKYHLNHLEEIKI
jgi:hypothetical protein